MESSLRLNAITNCFGRIHDSITKLESIALTSSGYDTAPSLPLQALPQMSWNDFLCLQDIELSTRQPVYGTNARLT